VYPLSGMLKCELCGTNYTGDRGIYRCNRKTKAGVDCPNNNISQMTAEEAISFLLDQHVLDVKNFKIFTEKIRAHFKKDHSQIRSLERNLEKINTQIHKVMRLYRLGTIDDTEIEAELLPLQIQKKTLADSIENLKADKGVYDISEKDVKEVLSNLEDEVKHADPKIRKRAFQTLFEEIRISPKKGSPWERLLVIKGVQVPLTRVKVASPRGFEPLLPA
jgi:site-specific DNA recombinase